MQPEMTKELKALQVENARLKKLVANQALDMEILREATPCLLAAVKHQRVDRGIVRNSKELTSRDGRCRMVDGLETGKGRI
jgi:hypothetical protein